MLCQAPPQRGNRRSSARAAVAGGATRRGLVLAEAHRQQRAEAPRTPRARGPRRQWGWEAQRGPIRRLLTTTRPRDPTQGPSLAPPAPLRRHRRESPQEGLVAKHVRLSRFRHPLRFPHPPALLPAAPPSKPRLDALQATTRPAASARTGGADHAQDRCRNLCPRGRKPATRPAPNRGRCGDSRPCARCLHRRLRGGKRRKPAGSPPCRANTV
mmetsp:Transcript_25408/g.70748  ORF Transcript_25408/g.70748 Transcript_25408/m.70748 type:complete len:213 (-) Transcript_25408:298-936(-)